MPANQPSAPTSIASKLSVVLAVEQRGAFGAEIAQVVQTGRIAVRLLDHRRRALLCELGQIRNVDADAGGAGVVVDHQRDFDRLRDVTEVLPDLAERRPRIVRRHAHHRSGTRLLGMDGEGARLPGGGVHDTDDGRHSTCDVLDRPPDQRATLIRVERAELATGPRDQERVDTGIDQPVEVIEGRVVVDRTVFREDGDRRDDNAELGSHVCLS
ncbi:MAG: hypothetical protein QM714_16250 [Nocardioides sp.]